jgi:hypothetical protein
LYNLLDPITDEDITRLCAYSNKRFRWQLPEVAPRWGGGAICLRNLIVDPCLPKEKATPRVMPCCHAFHEGCIFLWLWKKTGVSSQPPAPANAAGEEAAAVGAMFLRHDYKATPYQ